MTFKIRQYLSLLFVAAIANTTFFAISVKAQTTSVVSEAGCVREPQAYIAPELLASMAYRGAFSKEGIPGYAVFQTEFNSGNVTAAKIVEAAMKACILSDKYGMGSHENYLEEVKSQIQFMIRESSD